MNLSKDERELAAFIEAKKARRTPLPDDHPVVPLSQFIRPPGWYEAMGEAAKKNCDKGIHHFMSWHRVNGKQCCVWCGKEKSNG